jgi:hypothetical protein
MVQLPGILCMIAYCRQAVPFLSAARYAQVNSLNRIFPPVTVPG